MTAPTPLEAIKRSRRNDLDVLRRTRLENNELRRKIWRLRYSRRVLRAEVAHLKAQLAESRAREAAAEARETTA